MTAAEFDVLTAERVARIAANPNPRRPWSLSVAWGRARARLAAFFAHVHGQPMDREAAVDSFRNVLTVIGAGTVIGDFTGMRVWLMLPMAVVFALLWYIDYVRHF